MTKPYNCFNVIAQPELVLELSSDVMITESDSNQITVTIETDDDTLKTFKVYQKGNSVYVKQEPSDGGFNISSNNVNFVGGSFNNVIQTGRGINISQVNGNTYINGGSGKVYVNGKPIDMDSSNSESNYQPPKIKITVPEGTNLDANLSGSCVLASQVKLNDVILEIAGSTKAAIMCTELDLDTSGASEVRAVLFGGELSINVSGSSKVDVQGNYSKVKVDLSGMGNIKTSGECRGDYKVSASGMGKVYHSGTVLGRVRESKSGMASISVQA